jgi:streptogramin lyase
MAVAMTPTNSANTAVAVPKSLPAPGAYSEAQSITLTDSTPGATIYYEVLGELSFDQWVKYTTPIAISEPGETTIMVYASKGSVNSAYATLGFELNLPHAATPVISMPSGTYPGPQKVKISDSTPGAVLYYTIDGAAPTTKSAKYTNPVTISYSSTLVAVAIAPGYSFSAETSAQYLVRSSPTSYIYTVAGSGVPGYQGDGQLATSADLNNPSATVIDKDGNLYIADSNNSVIRKVAAGTGIITTFAGNGHPGYEGDGGPTSLAELSSPACLAFDNAGNLYIADTGAYVIRKVEVASGVITTYAGNGTYGNLGDGGLATKAELGYVYGMAFDKSGNLFLADSGYNVVREVLAGTGTITTVVGDGEVGYGGDDGPPSRATLYAPPA